MPLLAQEPSVYPDHLLNETPDLTAGKDRWWLVYTRPRMEKALARRLFARQHSFFLPLYQRCWKNAGRAHESFLPLFPGYLFLFGTEESRRTALETNLVVQAFPVTDQDRLHVELGRVHRAIASGTGLMPEDRVVPGSLVEVIDGPFQGLQGVVVRRGRERRLVIEVQLLRRGVSMELEDWMTRPVHSVAAGGILGGTVAASLA